MPVPYARIALLQQEDGVWVQYRTCPACQQNIREELDDDQKPVNSDYARHYQEAHQ